MYHNGVMLRIENVKIFEDLSDAEVKTRALKKAGIRPEDVTNIRIVKKSIDARDKKQVHYTYAFDVEVKKKSRYPKVKSIPPLKEEQLTVKRNSPYRPIIVGSGPAGLFCALQLAEYGVPSVIIERGDRVEMRQNYVKEYREAGKLNEKCNVQFGEGGAGTFSDGKLTTGISSSYIRKVLEWFYQFGAPEEVTYLSHPHIGTDNLIHILKNIRTYLEEKGCTYYFNTQFTSFEENNGVLSVHCDTGLTLKTDALVLAIGHSARDTLRYLHDRQMEMHAKNFAVGVRCEHLQSEINVAQYGSETKLKLPAAEYKLVYHDPESGRACYSFCMCPGGEVIASSSEDGHLVTNGMSNFRRDGANANAALLVNVTVDDLKNTDPLAGIRYQEELEEKAYKLGGSNHFAPIQRLEDFMKNQPSDHIGKVTPTYRPGVTLCDLNTILPEYVADTLKKGFVYFDQRIHGFADPDTILTGLETRTSSPVSIVRNESLQSTIPQIYPCGEGAGYAGGITSAAVDGIKVANSILQNS